VSFLAYFHQKVWLLSAPQFMSNAFYFNLILFFLVAIIALEVLAKKLRWPPAVAQLIGGALIAFIPGLPAFEIDPALVLVVFLPPLLMAGAAMGRLFCLRGDCVATGCHCRQGGIAAGGIAAQIAGVAGGREPAQ